jgi:hypothetical protein
MLADLGFEATTCGKPLPVAAGAPAEQRAGFSA